MEWKNDSNIPSLLNEAEKWLQSEPTDQIVLVGDSTGANFAYQLRERLKEEDIKSILILTSPLLNVEDRTSDFEFPKNIIPQLENQGYRVDYKGVGKIKEQFPLEGTIINKDQRIYLQLQN